MKKINQELKFKTLLFFLVGVALSIFITDALGLNFPKNIAAIISLVCQIGIMLILILNIYLANKSRSK